MGTFIEANKVCRSLYYLFLQQHCASCSSNEQKQLLDRTCDMNISLHNHLYLSLPKKYKLIIN